MYINTICSWLSPVHIYLQLYPWNVNVFWNARKLSLLFCPRYKRTRLTLNRLGFGMFKPVGTAMFWLHLLIYFIVPVVTDSSVLIWSNIVLNRWKRSIRVCRNQRRTNYVHVIDVDTVYFVHQGISVAQSLFTLNEHTITNVCLNLRFLLKIIYIMIKHTFQINF